MNEADEKLEEIKQVNQLAEKLRKEEGQHRNPLPEFCRECVVHLIAGASYYPCALVKGHKGGHRASGKCFKHGPYIGEEGKPPQCPRWPECVEGLRKEEEKAK